MRFKFITALVTLTGLNVTAARQSRTTKTLRIIKAATLLSIGMFQRFVLQLLSQLNIFKYNNAVQQF